MNRVDAENVLRPMLYNLGVVGKRGPVPGWVLPMMISGVCLLVLILILLIKIYESITTGACMVCGMKHKNDK
ncbi:hypothetical protein BST79_gp155 [Only Syngen Nebraska virus 5]|uniref:hypothetical protein n=1 Tax=Only Syngen Nebraska virus 5 TaxID=1917232 RepID=UPI0009012393|nr:hypothetical protein BST79_gp155 [Only Syngen Nebraska virus 5]APC25668.1 hypothetical protein [Only Syngen Nebraska virus 5]